jgi:hypothetical protein
VAVCQGTPDPASGLSPLLLKPTGLIHPLPWANPFPDSGKPASVRARAPLCGDPRPGSSGYPEMASGIFTACRPLWSRLPPLCLMSVARSTPHPPTQSPGISLCPFCLPPPKPKVGRVGTHTRRCYLPCQPHPDLRLLPSAVPRMWSLQHPPCWGQARGRLARGERGAQPQSGPRPWHPALHLRARPAGDPVANECPWSVSSPRDSAGGLGGCAGFGGGGVPRPAAAGTRGGEGAPGQDSRCCLLSAQSAG